MSWDWSSFGDAPLDSVAAAFAPLGTSDSDDMESDPLGVRRAPTGRPARGSSPSDLWRLDFDGSTSTSESLESHAAWHCVRAFSNPRRWRVLTTAAIAGEARRRIGGGCDVVDSLVCFALESLADRGGVHPSAIVRYGDAGSVST